MKGVDGSSYSGVFVHKAPLCLVLLLPCFRKDILYTDKSVDAHGGRLFCTPLMLWGNTLNTSQAMNN